eukprot:581457-Amphidinium_carterae.2
MSHCAIDCQRTGQDMPGSTSGGQLFTFRGTCPRSQSKTAQSKLPWAFTPRVQHCRVDVAS